MKKRAYPSFLSRVTILFMAFLMAISPNTAVLAYDELFYTSNDILYYDPAGGCVGPGANYTTRMDLPSLIGNDNAEKVWNFLTNEGELTPDQAAGVMGNIQQESGYDPTIEESAESAARHTVRPVGFGIVQWTGGRRLALEAAAALKGVQSSDLGFQLAFLLEELKSRQVYIPDSSSERFADVDRSLSEWEVIKSLNSMEDALVLFHDSFERSQDTAEEVVERRGGYAQQALDSFRGGSGGGAAGSSSPSGGDASCAPFAGGDLVQTLLAYAHPKYHAGTSAPVTPPPKPAYQEAAEKLVSDKKWVGGGAMEGDSLQAGYPAIDCGGFVSILLTQSGFEPDYNYGLDPSRGASNQNGKWSGGSDPGGGQMGWAMRNWTFLGRGGDINVSDLRPGDVAYSNGHTFLFVGDVSGFDSQFASASYASSSGEGWRSPMSAGSFESATAPGYVWYGRREGSPPAYGSTNRTDAIIAGNDHYPGEQGARNW